MKFVLSLAVVAYVAAAVECYVPSVSLSLLYTETNKYATLSAKSIVLDFNSDCTVVTIWMKGLGQKGPRTPGRFPQFSDFLGLSWG